MSATTAPVAAPSRAAPSGPTLLALHFLDTAVGWAERALDDAVGNPDRARRHLGIARVALVTARWVRASGADVEVRP